MYETRTWKTKLLKGEMNNLMLDVFSRHYVHQIYRIASNVCRNSVVKGRELIRQGKLVWPTFTNKQNSAKVPFISSNLWRRFGGQFLRSSSQQSTRECKMGGEINILNKLLLTFGLKKFQIIGPNTRKMDIRLWIV